MRRQAVCIFLVAAASGCGGGYVLTGPDCLAPVGGQMPVAVRLERRELPLVTPAAKDVPLRFRLADGPPRAARTNGTGYASAFVPAPETAGEYPLTVSLQDIEGNEAAWELRAFVWDANRRAVAVDLAALPRRGSELENARVALVGLAASANILYLTDSSPAWGPKLHEAMKGAGLPDGPILYWRAAGWRRDRIVGPLEELRKALPRLEVGIAGSTMAVRAFESAGMKCLRIGRRTGREAEDTQATSWAELAERGMEAAEQP